ncbi:MULTISPECIES: hypothetical protein [Exiguobacterium]|uniref:hypothetical protein n=1 Tax=Exiguobacterium TaxID=33986 RepID=UPI001BEBB125|nr:MULTISPECIES: hypothetical protein [Exiguobacterium]MCA0982064.1 hypothetical protein [Exiguobacterium aestuarii]MDA5561620.1 hypothetical protein [Exiguobacterium sp. MMG028]
MKYIYQLILVSMLFMIGAPTTVMAETEPVVIHENIIVEEEVEIHEGFQSPNEMVYVFVLIVLLSVVGLGIMNTIE